MEDYSGKALQSMREYWIKKQKEAEADAQRHTFNPGSLLTAIASIVAAPMTGGASLSYLPAGFISAGGEGLRANMGGDTNWGDVWNMGSSLGDILKPKVKAPNSVMTAYPQAGDYSSQAYYGA
jgi:hypothetical protein